MRLFVVSRPALWKMLKEVLRKKNDLGQKSDLHKERKNIREGISEYKIKSFIFLFFLFLIDPTDKNLFKILAIYLIIFMYKQNE